MSSFQYTCPDCGTTNILHDTDCKYDHEQISRFEKPYIDVLSVLSGHAAYMERYGANPVLSYDTLQEKVEQLHEDSWWSDVHADCLSHLVNSQRVVKEDGLYRMRQPDEQVERLIPGFDPLRPIYEYGPVDGCKDYAVFTMISWCNLKDMTWEQTKNFCTEWLEESGSWERESWGESSIEVLLNSKRHVWSGGYGWGDKARVAANEIRDADIEKGIDVRDKYGAEYSDYA